MKLTKLRTFLIAVATAVLALLGASACTLDFETEKLKIRAAEQQITQPNNQAVLVSFQKVYA